MLVSADNPTAIVAPFNGSDPGYIIAESQGGLANRLRVLAAYMHIAENKFNGAHTAFIWDINDACPGHFLNLFQPISNVIFAGNNSRYVLDKHAKIVYENSMAVFTWTLQMNNIPKNRHGFPTWPQIEFNMYSRYLPLRRISHIVEKFVRRHNICNSTAMHIRTTDLERMVMKKKQKQRQGQGEKQGSLNNDKFNLEPYHQLVASLAVDQTVFLMTDRQVTERLYDIDVRFALKIFTRTNLAVVVISFTVILAAQRRRENSWSGMETAKFSSTTASSIDDNSDRLTQLQLPVPAAVMATVMVLIVTT